VALRRQRPSEAYRASLEEIVAESERMTQLVDDLLSLARADTQTVEMPLTPLPLNDVVRDVCEEMRSIASLRQIAIDVAYCDESSMVPANRAALHRLLLVLLDNAIKYSRYGGLVRLAVSSDADRVRVSIADSGAGIDAQSLPHIFKRFYRADPARSGHGHGLGLSLAESIARAHSAIIHVESKEGEGSRFHVIFPSAAQGILSFPR
jgi:signal transduction histidine kinase